MVSTVGFRAIGEGGRYNGMESPPIIRSTPILSPALNLGGVEISDSGEDGEDEVDEELDVSA